MKPVTAAAFLALCLLAAPGSLAADGADVVTAFTTGERLEYVLKWAGIAAGDSVMEIVPGEVVDGRGLLKVVSTAESRALIDVFYKVRNRYETHVHPGDGLTRKYYFEMNEGSKHRKRTLLFHQNDHIVTRIVTRDGQTQSQVFEVPPEVQDNLSSLYTVRNMDLVVGESVVIPVFESRKNWEVVVDVLARERIKVDAGTFDTIKIHPKLKFEGMFRRKGDLIVWVTDDQYKVPVLMKSKVSIGSVDAELVRYRLGDGTAPAPAHVEEEGTEGPTEESREDMLEELRGD